MKKYLILAVLLLTASLCAVSKAYLSTIADRNRLARNQTALSDSVRHYKTKAGDEAASVQVLRLRCSEFERMRAEDARRIREIGIKVRRLEAAATLVAEQRMEVAAPLRDTFIVRQRDTVLLRDTIRMFRWNDAWCTVEGTILPDSVVCKIETVDTLRQIVHRVPRRFLFIRWGTKAIRQEIVSSNPHTKIVHAEYVRLER